MKAKKILFLNLYTYSLTGGIEKVCRNFIGVLQKLKQQKTIASALSLSMHDEPEDRPEELEKEFIAFNSNKIKFALSTVKHGLNSNVIILSHINLLFFARIILKLKPNVRVVLLAHGIEIWRPLAKWKTDLLRRIDIWAVSNYTADQINKIHQVKLNTIQVLNNSLEANFVYPAKKIKPTDLIEKHQLNKDTKVILTVCRISTAEQYKGYDLMLLALKDVIKAKPNLKYFIVGKADNLEKARIEALINAYGLNSYVYLTGFISDQEIKKYYQLADIYAMPSKSEGFGIAFLEAVANGCQVIAGNADGSKDALLNGQLGCLVDPENVEEIYSALIKQLENPIDAEEIKNRQTKLKEKFSFEVYQENIVKLLSF